MDIPEEAEYFKPQELKRIFAAEALFLLDPEHVGELSAGDSGWIGRLTGPGGTRSSTMYREGAVVPALGLERGFYTVLVRSTETDGAMVPLSHLAFSAGFVLGTETGSLAVATFEDLVEGHLGRTVQVSPGWYGVTVVAGIREHEDGDEGAQEEWVVCFLLDPQGGRPEFAADMGTMLGIFG